MTTRAVIAAAILILAVASAPDIPLDYLPNVVYPDITVSLTMPASAAADPIETTNRWIIPVESTIRSLGDVIATRGEVSADSARILVRFRPGTDPELKTARLTAELARVRSMLPYGAQVNVWPTRQSSDATAYLALTGATAGQRAEQVADELRTVEGVREVWTFGSTERETDVALHSSLPPEIDAQSVRETILRDVAPRRFGETRWGSRSVAVISPAVARMEDVFVARSLRLGSVATLRTRHATPDTLARVNGKPAVMLVVYRDEDASIFRFDAALRAKQRKLALEEVWSEAGEMRSLLRHAAAGLLAASLLFAAGGLFAFGRRGLVLGLYPLLAVAVAVSITRIVALPVDASTIMAVAIAIAGVAPLATQRLTRGGAGLWPAVVTLLFIALLPIAAALGSGRLAPLLSAPARAFALGGVAAVIASQILAPIASAAQATSGRVVRRSLRNGASIVLACVATATFLLAWFGDRLDPRRSGEAAAQSRIYVGVTLPAGTTLAETTAAVERVESAVRGLDEIARFWSFVEASRATVVLELRNEAQDAQRQKELRWRLRSRIRLGPGAVSIAERSSFASASRFSDDLEERPETDEEATRYRLLLKGSDAVALQRAYDSIEVRLRRAYRRVGIEGGWASTSTRVELVPLPSTSPEVARTVARQLAGRTLPPVERELPDGRTLRVRDAGAPETVNEVPRMADVFAHRFEAGTIPSLFAARTNIVVGRVTREVGRFVLPVMIWVPGYEEERARNRVEIDRILSLTPLPPGTAMNRPSLAAWQFSREKIRLFGLAAFLPLLIFAAATVVLNSFARALVALAPALLGVAFAAPLLMLTGSEVDEVTLLAMGGAVCCVAATTAVAAARSRDTDGTYRTLRDSAVPMLVTAGAATALLAIPAAANEAVRSNWRPPLVAAATVMFAGFGGGSLTTATLLLVSRDIARRSGRKARVARRPAAWSDPDVPVHLAVRSVTKRYPSGFRALHQVSFELGPGIVGLLGPNGAGKTTLLRIITGLLTPTRGQVIYRGVTVGPENLVEYRRAIGFLPQEFNAYAGLTAAQFLDYWALERGMNDRRKREEEIAELLTVVGLEEEANRRVRDFSGGMRQRIGIARALLDNPPLLVVDEPTTGLDIQARARFRGLIVSLARNRAIIVSTHIASDLEGAKRLLLMTRGHLRFDGTIEQLIADARGRVFEMVVSDKEAREMSRRYRVTTRVRLAGGIRIRGVIAETDVLPGVAVEPSLEEAYLAAARSEGPLRLGSFSFLSERS